MLKSPYLLYPQVTRKSVPSTIPADLSNIDVTTSLTPPMTIAARLKEAARSHSDACNAPKPLHDSKRRQSQSDTALNPEVYAHEHRYKSVDPAQLEGLEEQEDADAAHRDCAVSPLKQSYAAVANDSHHAQAADEREHSTQQPRKPPPVSVSDHASCKPAAAVGAATSPAAGVPRSKSASPESHRDPEALVKLEERLVEEGRPELMELAALWQCGFYGGGARKQIWFRPNKTRRLASVKEAVRQLMEMADKQACNGERHTPDLLRLRPV